MAVKTPNVILYLYVYGPIIIIECSVQRDTNEDQLLYLYRDIVGIATLTMSDDLVSVFYCGFGCHKLIS
jgi:hypothetical protein